MNESLYVELKYKRKEINKKYLWKNVDPQKRVLYRDLWLSFHLSHHPSELDEADHQQWQQVDLPAWTVSYKKGTPQNSNSSCCRRLIFKFWTVAPGEELQASQK